MTRKQIHNYDHGENINQSRSSSRGGAALTAAVDNLPAVGGERASGERASGDRGRGRGQDGGRGGGGRRGGRGRGRESNDEVIISGGEDVIDGCDGNATKALMNYEKCPCRINFRRGGAPREPKQLPILKNDRCVLCSSKGQVSFIKVTCARLAHPMWHAKMYLCVNPRRKGRL